MPVTQEDSIHLEIRALQDMCVNMRSIYTEKTRILTVLKTAQLLSWMKDADHRYLYASETLCSLLLKCAPAAAIGKNDNELADARKADGVDVVNVAGCAHCVINAPEPVSEDSQEFSIMAMHGCYGTDEVTKRAGSSCHFYEVIKVPGKLLCLDVRKTPLFDKDGNFAGTVGIATDVTPFKLYYDAMVEKLVSDGRAKPLCTNTTYYQLFD